MTCSPVFNIAYCPYPHLVIFLALSAYITFSVACKLIDCLYSNEAKADYTVRLLRAGSHQEWQSPSDQVAPALAAWKAILPSIVSLPQCFWLFLYFNPTVWPGPSTDYRDPTGQGHMQTPWALTARIKWGTLVSSHLAEKLGLVTNGTPNGI